MKITHIHIKNLLGIQDLELTPGAVTVISGQNGTGKTSVIESVKAALSKGHDATLLRKGEKAGEAVLVLDDGLEIRKRVTEKTSTTTMTAADGSKISKPASELDKLIDLLSVNPVEFLSASPKERARILLETLPIKLDVEELARITKLPINPVGEPLAYLDSLRKQIYDDRTGVNRAVKEKEATIQQMIQTMPEAPGGASGDENELRAMVAQADTQKAAELERIGSKLQGIRDDTAAKIAAIREEAERQVQALRDALAERETKAASVRERVITSHAEAVREPLAALAAIAADRNNAARREQAVQLIKQMEKGCEDLREHSENQTEALKNLDLYRASLLESLPIPGLEIVNGDVYRNGVHFDRLNTAQKVDVAVEVAKLRAGTLGIVCVDGIELMDSATFEQFCTKAAESGLQMIVSRVTDGQFNIESK